MASNTNVLMAPRAASHKRNVQDLAPGSILQRMYLRERMQGRFKSSVRFLEIGAGKGHTSRVLLELGHSGVSLDLNADACAQNQQLNSTYIETEQYQVDAKDVFDCPPDGCFDIVISSMVIEHLTTDSLCNYFELARRLLNPGGIIVQFVPASMKFWGVEDVIAGHYKRYTPACFHSIAAQHGLVVDHIAGLTYPISNILLPVSNYLVCRAERAKAELTMRERTISSGDRKVFMKTSFPGWLALVLNPVTMYPLHLLQKLCRGHRDAMVLYCELSKKGPSDS